MSAYEPPTADYPVFDSLVFQTPNTGTLTQEEADARYLARINTATSIAGSTNFTGDVTAPSFLGNYRTTNTTANATHFLNFSDASVTGVGTIQKTAGIEVNPNTKVLTATRLNAGTFSTVSGSAILGAAGGTALTADTNNVVTFANSTRYKQSIINITSNITPPFSEIYICTPTANIVWTLTAGNYAGVHIYIRKLNSSFSLQITVTSGLILDNSGAGFGSVTIAAAQNVCDLINDGSNWIARFS